MTGTGKRLDRIARAIALVPAAVLAAVAVGQMVVAYSSDLSPWKGGGFGMFSTIDSPGARVVRAFLLREGEQLPVVMPDALREFEMEARTHPSQKRLDEIAKRLAAGAWVPYRLLPASEHFRQLRARYRAERGLTSAEPDIPISAHTLQTAALLERAFEELGMVRMLGEDEFAAEVEQFDSARVEVWRLTLDRSGRALVLRQIRSATAPRHD